MPLLRSGLGTNRHKRVQRARPRNSWILYARSRDALAVDLMFLHSSFKCLSRRKNQFPTHYNEQACYALFPIAQADGCAAPSWVRHLSLNRENPGHET
jgi:hypothetical protein